MAWQLACYVRASQQLIETELNRESNPRAFVNCRDAVPASDSEFYSILQPETQFYTPEHELAALSARMDTDVLWLSFRSDMNLFEFHRWRSGSCVRVLEYEFASGVWVRAEGTPEPWEQRAFDSPPIPQATVEISAQRAAQAMAEYYGIPNWSCSESDIS